MAVLFLLVGGLLAITAECPYSNDDVAHYLMARHAGENPKLFLDMWGRPGFTVLHFLPAQLGFGGCRAFSLLLSCLAGWMVAHTVRPLGAPYPALAMGLTVFQATFLQLAFGALTETVYATFLAAGLLLIARRRYALSALAFSWTAITRLEGTPMLLVFAAYFVVREWRAPEAEKRGKARTLLYVALLGTFPLLWYALLFVHAGFTEPLGIFGNNHFLSSPQNFYGSGAWYHFAVSSWDIHGPVIVVLMFVGLCVMPARRRWLVPIYVVLFYTMQSVLWTFGLFRTGGYARFVTSIAPAAAIAATYGAAWLIARLESRARWIGRPAFLWALILVTIVFSVVRIQIQQRLYTSRTYAAIDRAIEDIQASGGLAPGQTIVAGGYTAMRLDLNPWDRQRMLYPCTANVANAAAGTLILFTGHRPAPSDNVDILHFYDEQDARMARRRMAKGLNWVHLLTRTRPQYRQLRDYSVLDNEDLDTEPWPYYVKLFLKVDTSEQGKEENTKVEQR